MTVNLPILRMDARIQFVLVSSCVVPRLEIFHSLVFYAS